MKILQKKSIFASVVIIFIAVGYFIFTKEPESLEGWKIYKNIQAGYELQIPSDTKIGTILKPTTYFSVPDNATIEISSFPKLDSEIASWDSYKLSNESDVVIAGKKAKVWVNQDTTMAGDPYTSYNIENDGYIYLITFRFTKNRELSSVEKQILSTFKFIK